tara:strand:- start:1043 stop:1333 length:291 start_codon:yes stop_codon:yes gene_type:complete
MIGEQDLWISVIQGAFFDALRPDKVKREGKYVENPFYLDIRKGKDYLTSNSRGFRDVCFLAGLDPDWVMYKYKNLLTSKLSKKDLKRYINGFNYTH